MRFTPAATMRSASMSRPESVSSRTPRVGSSTVIWRISLRFFSPPENPSFTGRFTRSTSKSSSFTRSRIRPRKSTCVELGLAAVFADLVDRGFQEVGVVHAGDLDRVLEGEEDAAPRPLLRGQLRDVLAPVADFAGGDLVSLAAGDHMGERALARPVRTHHRVGFAERDLEVESPQDFPVFRWRPGGRGSAAVPSSDRPFEAHPEQLLRFHRKLHRQFGQHRRGRSRSR